MKKSGKKEHQKSVPDDVYLLGKARKHQALAMKSLKRGDTISAITHVLNANVFLDVLNEYIALGRVPKPNWYRLEVKSRLVKLGEILDRASEKEEP